MNASCAPNIPEFRRTACLFTRALALVYLAAFLSLAFQITGLAGQNGILPVQDYLRLAAAHLGSERYWRIPTLAWLSAGDGALSGACWAGVFFSLLLLAGGLPGVSALALWVLYLSLTHAGQDFLSFQWDILLLECGFLALFLVPWTWREKFASAEPKFKIVIWLYRWLLFRLIAGSGLVKWLSGDPAWRNLTALSFHYETTPLPVWTGWYFHHLPLWFHKISCAAMFGIEILAPLLMLAGRRGRRACFVLQAGFQLFLIATGNYAFFNWLTLALCLLLLDDACLPGNRGAMNAAAKRCVGAPAFAAYPVFAFLLLLGVMNFSGTLRLQVPWPAALRSAERLAKPFFWVNRYGLFAVMTQKRPEIILEGSQDGKLWQPYEFRWKPGLPERRPEFVAPHQPRLDWQMWFAALGNYRSEPWVPVLMKRLMLNTRDVSALLKTNPFAGNPPRYLRAVVYEYHFTSAEERRTTRRWWTRQPLGLYCPVLARIGTSLFFTNPPKASG